MGIERGRERKEGGRLTEVERERKEGGRLTEVEIEEDIKRQEEREIVER